MYALIKVSNDSLNPTNVKVGTVKYSKKAPRPVKGKSYKFAAMETTAVTGIVERDEVKTIFKTENSTYLITPGV